MLLLFLQGDVHKIIKDNFLQISDQVKCFTKRVVTIKHKNSTQKQIIQLILISALIHFWINNQQTAKHELLFFFPISWWNVCVTKQKTWSFNGCKKIKQFSYSQMLSFGLWHIKSKIWNMSNTPSIKWMSGQDTTSQDLFGTARCSRKKEELNRKQSNTWIS